MKFVDYLLLNHIANKAASRSAKEAKSKEERQKEAKEITQDLNKISVAAPLAYIGVIISILFFVLFFSKPVIRWLCVFTLVESLFTIFHNLNSYARKKKYFFLNSLSALISFAGIYTFFALGYTKIGIAVFILGFVFAIVITVNSSSVWGSPELSASSEGSV